MEYIQPENLKRHQAVLVELLLALDGICKKHDIPYQLFAGSALGAIRHGGIIPWDDDLDVAMLRSDYERFLEVAKTELDSEKYYSQSEFSEHWPMFFSKIRKNNTTCLEMYHPRSEEFHQGIYIDIFPIDNARKTKLGRGLQFLASKIVLAKSLDKRGYSTNSMIKKLFMFGCKLLPMSPFLHFTKAKGLGDSTALVHSFFAATSKYKHGVYPREWFTETIPVVFEGREFPISAHHDALLTRLYGDYMTLPSEDDKLLKVHAILVDVDKNYTEYEHYRNGMKFHQHTRSIR